LRHLDTGLIYRAVAKALLDGGHSPGNRARAVAAAEALDPTQFDEPALKSPAVGEAASVISAVPEVRGALLSFQRSFGRTPPGAVLDGRDIGTVIFPDADVKIFLTATAETRAQRRAVELERAGNDISEAEVLADIRRRARYRQGGSPIKAGAGSILARYHAFGYRRRIPGRHRHCRSRPSRPDARLTAFPLLEDEPAPPASLMAHWI
jgi:cytidylate kinase